MTDPNGNQETYGYDPTNGNRLVSHTDALGGLTSYGYDTRGFLDAVTDPNGHTTTYQHDSLGDVIGTTKCRYGASGTPYLANNCYTATATFDTSTSTTDYASRKVLTSTDGRNSEGAPAPAAGTYTTTYTYNAQGLLASTTSPPVYNYTTQKNDPGLVTKDTYTSASTPSADGGTGPGLQVATVTDPKGLVTSYTYYSSGQIASETDPNGRVTKYTYSPQGSGAGYGPISSTVVSDAYPSGTTTDFSYDAQGRLLSETDPATVDAVTGVTHTKRTTNAYDLDGNLASVTVADLTGGDATRTTSYTYNADDELASVTDPLGRKTSYTYDTSGNRITQTRPDGTTLAYAYSATGQLTTTTLQGWTGDPTNPSPATNIVLESRAYDPAGRLASVTDAMGRTTSYTYTDDDQVSDIISAAGTSDAIDVRDTFNGAGELVHEQVVSPYPGELDLPPYWQRYHTYDAAGRLVFEAATGQSGWTITAGGSTQNAQLTLDADGNVLTAVTGLVNNYVTVQSRTTTYTYDNAGDLLTTSVADGSNTLTSSATYDQLGERTSSTDPNGNTTHYTYDPAGQLTTTTSPPVSVETYGQAPVTAPAVSMTGYDTFGDPVEADNADGQITTTGFDLDGEPTSQTQPSYIPPGSATAITPTSSTSYTNLGQPATTTDPLGRQTSAVYDQLGDAVQTTVPGGGVWHASFDLDGEQLSETGPTGAQTQATYDNQGRVLTQTQVERTPAPAAYTTTYGYAPDAQDTAPDIWTWDPNGGPTTVTDPQGNTTHYGYNGMGQRVFVIEPLGNVTDTEPNLDGNPLEVTAADGTTTTNTYDNAGRLTSAVAKDSTGKTTLRTVSYGYDNDGNQTSSTDGAGNTTTSTYDALGRLTGQSQPVKSGVSLTTSFGYDAAGNQTRYTDPNSNATYYTYNSLGLPESKIVPAVAGDTSLADRATTTAYDADGRPVSQSLPGGVSQAVTYTPAGQVATQSGSGAEAATGTRTFTYDAAGRVLTAATPVNGSTGGTNTYTYDDRGLLLTASGPSGATSYAYDGNGEMTSRTDAAGTATFTYNGDLQLATQTGPYTGMALTDTYSPAGQLTGTSYGTGAASQTYAYDGLHQLTSDTLKNPAGAVEASTAYTYNGDSQILTATTTGLAGAGTTTDAYDQAGRLTSSQSGGTSAPVTAYGYDGDGNRTSIQTGTNPAATATYDARDQLDTTVNAGTTTSYGYTARGTTSSVTTGGTTGNQSFDAFGQQITAGSSTYSYDALGRMATASTSAGNYTFAYDGQTDQLASDGHQTYARTPTGQLAGQDTAGDSTGANAQLALTNTHGDVTGLFTSAGTSLNGSTAYTPWGQTSSTTGTATSDLGFQGGWTDATNGQLATASRTYTPATGTFTSTDPTTQPPSPAANANPFSYGAADPANHTDTSGHDACTDYEEEQIQAEEQQAQEEAEQREIAEQDAAMEADDLETELADDSLDAAEHAEVERELTEDETESDAAERDITDEEQSWDDEVYRDNNDGLSQEEVQAEDREAAQAESEWLDEHPGATPSDYDRATEGPEDDTWFDGLTREAFELGENDPEIFLAGLPVGENYSVNDCGSSGEPTKPTDPNPQRPTNPESNPTGGRGPSNPLTRAGTVKEDPAAAARATRGDIQLEPNQDPTAGTTNPTGATNDTEPSDEPEPNQCRPGPVGGDLTSPYDAGAEASQLAREGVPDGPPENQVMAHMPAVQDLLDELMPPPPGAETYAAIAGQGEVPAFLTGPLGAPPVDPSTAVSLLFPTVFLGVTKGLRLLGRGLSGPLGGGSTPPPEITPSDGC